MRNISIEALKGLLEDIQRLDTDWYRVRQSMIEYELITEERAWEPDWMPWEDRFKRAIWERIDKKQAELSATRERGGSRE